MELIISKHKVENMLMPEHNTEEESIPMDLYSPEYKQQPKNVYKTNQNHFYHMLMAG